jgi:DNA-directed RNA polymerase subunit RPC12/RpoP
MGRARKSRRCPLCGSRDILLQDAFDYGVDLYMCANCDHEFEVGRSRSKRGGSDFDYADELESDVSENEWD